jgi:nucleotide-binding universal stress UspA family protein
MIRSVLVPLDGSHFGEHALPLAWGLARRASAKLALAHVHVSQLYVSELAVFDETLEQQRLTQERAYLEKMSDHLTRLAGVSVATTLLQGGVADALGEHAKASGADLIVLATHGRGPFSRFWLGSTADELVRTATVPLLLVRPQKVPVDLEHEQGFHRVLVPLDGSALAEQILEPAVTLGRLMPAEYTLLQVVPPLHPGIIDPLGRVLDLSDSGLDEKARASARAYLESVAERLRQQGLNVHTKLVTQPQAAPAILEEATEASYDLIALATHGRRGLARLFLGSVADKVVRGAPMPVLVYRPKTPSKGDRP